MINYGFIRVASAIPSVNVADVEANTQYIIDAFQRAINQGAQVVVCPELCVTAYTCADLFAHEALINSVNESVKTIAAETASANALLFIGAPVCHDGRLFNCAIAMCGGKILGVVPKTYLPNYREFYEKRWFASASDLTEGALIDYCGQYEIPFGTDILFTLNSGSATNCAKIAVDMCEDLWAPIPPSSIAALNGANVIVNLSASNEIIGKNEYRNELIKQQSARCLSAYIYSSAGYGESTTDLVFAGNAIIAEYGNILARNKRFQAESQVIVADVDVSMLNGIRMANGTFADSTRIYKQKYREVAVSTRSVKHSNLLRFVNPHPFVPADDATLDSRCEEIINIQVEGLMRRLEATRTKTITVGVSGGLDSTLAILVAVRAFQRLDLSTSGIYSITMPGFGTTDRTYTNAIDLMNALGTTMVEIPIREAVSQHFEDIGHNMLNHDTTYENCQARERTQILMDYANRVGGFVLGTGDLSELALGWCTYNADQMSMYGVNASIPKTLVQHLVRWFALHIAPSEWGESCKETLLDIVDTPISPELTPADENGNIKQKTEDLVGPYELHDFFIYNMIRHGFSPRKVFFLAKQAFSGDYDDATIKKWLTTFCRRFFTQQFKRSCMPDGPKVGSVTFSPRGDWRMPSDATSAVWLKECESIAVDEEAL